MNKIFEDFVEQCQIERYDYDGNLIELGVDVESYTDMVVRECIRIIRTQKLENVLPHNAFNEGIEFGVQALYTQTGVKTK